MLRTVLFAALAPFLLPGCQPLFGGCTDTACPPSGLRIDVRAKSGTMPQGTYAITVIADGHTLSNTCSVGSTNAGCTGSEPSFSFSVPGILEFSLLETPSHVDVSIAYEGTPFGHASFDPNYSTWRPNGDGCEPACRGALVAMDVDAPAAKPGEMKDAGGD